MDKSMEARRKPSTSSMAASNGVTKRKVRISENMNRDVVTVRDRPEKKERDPESLNRSKRRRSERFSRDVKEDSSDECQGDEDIKHNHRRKSFPSCRLPKHATSSKLADEMIGVLVPRKARSACIKRSPNCRPSSESGGGGFGEDRQRPPTSPGSCSFEVVSPSSSNVPVKEKKNEIENELEIEIAEVLSGLKKHTHCSKQEDYSKNSLKPLEAKGVEIGKAKTETGRSESVDNSTSGRTTTSVNGVLRLDSAVSHLVNSRDESNCRSKLDCDLTVPPIIPSSSPERVSDSIVTKDYCEQAKSVKAKEKTLVNSEMTSEEAKQKQVGKREWSNLDQETSRDSCLRLGKLDWSQPPQAGSVSAQQSSVLPLTVAVGGWPSGLPSQGYVYMTQHGKPLDGSNGSSTLVQGAPFLATRPRPRRCATHFFIAQNIQLHQHFVKSNNLPQPNKGSTYLKGGDLRPAAGNPSLQGSSPVLSLNSRAQDKTAVNTSPRMDKASESCHFTSARQGKSQQPPSSSSMVPAQAFTYSPNHHLQPVMVSSKSPRLTKNPCVAAGSTTINFNHPTSSASEASSPYFAVLPNNAYTFQLSSTPSQPLPFINGSFYSSPMFQPPHPLQKQREGQRETKAASLTSSSHRQPQANINSLSSQANVQKYRQQSQKLEAKGARDHPDSRGSHTQKGGPNGQIIKAPIQPQNFSVSFASFPGGSASANLNFSSSGYHIVPTHQASDSKVGGGSCSSNGEDPKKYLTWKPPAMMNGQTLVFDNPPRTLNFVSGTWPPPAATPVNGDHPVFTHHLTQKQQQSVRSKATAHSQPDSVPAASSQRKTPPTSTLTLCNSLQFQSQPQIRTQGQTQISFASPSHGQQVRPGGSSSSSVTGPAPLDPKANSSKASPLSPVPSSIAHAQDQTENSASGSTQKTSPVCGRNIPSIITSYPGHLSELKY